MFYKWVGNVSKKRGLDKKGVEKKGGRLWQTNKLLWLRAEVTYLLIKFNKIKSFHGSTKNTDNNGTNEQTYTQKYNIRWSK